jgi:arsenite/tail-anchored protein-transporting ATPase
LRLLLFAGAGGVGTTTAAAATAALAARTAKVLLVSPGLPGVPAGPGLVPVGDLRVLHVDARRRFEERWPAVAAEVALPPGMASLLTLLDVRDRAVGGDWDAVLVDAPPVPELLALGELAGSVERLWPARERIVHRTALGDAVGTLQSASESIRSLLDGASVRLVVAPSAPGVAAARRLITALTLHGYRVDSVIANRVLPAEAGDSPWATRVRAGQEAALAALDLGLPVLRAPYLATEPAFDALGREIYGPADPIAPAPPAAPLPVTRSGDEYELRVPLPFVRRSEVRLSRSGDDLVVTVGDQLRRLPLPPVLRRCVAVGATVTDGEVRVRFRPDPALWPAGEDR